MTDSSNSLCTEEFDNSIEEEDDLDCDNDESRVKSPAIIIKRLGREKKTLTSEKLSESPLNKLNKLQSMTDNKIYEDKVSEKSEESLEDTKRDDKNENFEAKVDLRKSNPISSILSARGPEIFKSMKKKKDDSNL